MEPLSATVHCRHVVWTVATYPLRVGNWLTASEPPLYDFWYLNYFLITLAISLHSCILNKVVEVYFLPVLVQKQLSSQVMKTPISGCALHKNWTSVPFYCEEGIPASVWPWWKFITLQNVLSIGTLGTKLQHMVLARGTAIRNTCPCSHIVIFRVILHKNLKIRPYRKLVETADFGPHWTKYSNENKVSLFCKKIISYKLVNTVICQMALFHPV